MGLARLLLCSPRCGRGDRRLGLQKTLQRCCDVKILGSFATMVPVVAAFFSLNLSGQPSAEGVRILTESVQAHGGAELLTALGDTRATGRRWAASGEGDIESTLDIRARGIDQVWIQSSSAQGVRLYVTDGRGGWVVEDGQRKAVSAADASNRPLELNPVSGFLAAFLRGRLVPRGAEWVRATVGTRTGGFYLVDVQVRRRDPSGADPLDRQRDYQLVVDAESYLLAGLRIPIHSRDGRLEADLEDLVYDDYRSVEGIVLPFRIERIVYGARQSVVELESFQLSNHGNIFVEP